MRSEPHTIGLPDGGILAYDVLGEPEGLPVVALHGTPGSRLQLRAADGPARRHGVALVVPDRPGYGRSTHDPTRTIGGTARHIEQLADHLGWRRFVVMGLSGGGPFAIATGARLPERVSAVVTIGGVGPLVPRDASLPPDRAMVRIARRSELAARLAFSALLRAGARAPDRAVDRFAALLAAADAALLADDGPLRRALIDDLQATSPTAARAAARDFRLFTRPWDVDLTAIRPPVEVWHGTEDRNVPVAHARVLASSCPTATLHVVEGAGHLLLATHHELVLGSVTGED